MWFCSCDILIFVSDCELTSHPQLLSVLKDLSLWGKWTGWWIVCAFSSVSSHVCAEARERCQMSYSATICLILLRQSLCLNLELTIFDQDVWSASPALGQQALMSGHTRLFMEVGSRGPEFRSSSFHSKHPSSLSPVPSLLLLKDTTVRILAVIPK